MVGIQRIIGIREVANTRRADDRGHKAESEHATVTDDLQFSPEAQRAAQAARLLEQAEKQAEIRAEEVSRAKEDLERGTYRVQQVVLQVAARMSKHLSESLA